MSLPNKKLELTSKAYSCCFLNSKDAAIGLQNGSIIIVDATTMTITKTLRAHAEGVRSITRSNNGKLLVTSSHDKSIKLWSLSSFQCIRTLTSQPNVIWKCEFSPDDNYFVSVSWGLIKVWDPLTGKCVKMIEGHKNWIVSCAHSPNSTQFVTASLDDTLRVWDTSTFDCLAVLVGHTKSVNCCIYTIDSKFLISGSSDTTLKIWDTQSFQCIKTLEGHTKIIRACLVSPNGQFLMSGSYDDTVKVWNISTWESLNTIRTPYPVHDSSISADGSHYLITNSNDKEVFLWDLDDTFWGNYIEDWDEEIKEEENINDLKTKYESEIQRLQNDAKMNQIRLESDIAELSQLNKKLIQENQDLQQIMEHTMQELEMLKSARISEIVHPSNSLSDYLVNSPQLEFSKEKILGKGTFGKVYQGTYYKSPVAIKKLRNISEEAMDDFTKEMKVLMSLKHSNIVTCFSYYIDKSSPYIVMEYMSNGSLYHWLRKQTEPLEESTIKRICREIALGMHYLHSRNPMIIHRDLKSFNVILDGDLHAFVSDFGLLKTKELIRNSSSVSWTAPEYLTYKRKNERNEKGDVYSFGVIVWELITRKIPWKDAEMTYDDIRDAVIDGEHLQIPLHCPQVFKQVLIQCWKPKPEQRPSFSVLVDVFQDTTPLEWIFQEGECFQRPLSPELQKVKELKKVRGELERIKTKF